MCDADVSANKPKVCDYIDDLEGEPVVGCLEDAEFVIYGKGPYDEHFACVDHLGLLVSEEEVSVVWPVDMPCATEFDDQTGRF